MLQSGVMVEVTMEKVTILQAGGEASEVIAAKSSEFGEEE